MLEGLRALYCLTVMEVRVALRLAGGAGIPDAARALDVAPSTIRTHVKSLYQKLDVHSQAELASLIDRIAKYLARNGYGTFGGASSIGSLVRRIIP